MYKLIIQQQKIIIYYIFSWYFSNVFITYNIIISFINIILTSLKKQKQHCYNHYKNDIKPKVEKR